MASDDIQGTITDSSGTAISGATVALWLQDSPGTVTTTTTDSSGNYIFENHPDGDGTSKTWHLAARDPNDSTRQFRSLHSVSASLPSPSAIPDSVLNRWRLAEGLGTTAVDDIGNDDLSISGATWESDGDSIGGQRLLFDGSDDKGTSNASENGSRTFTTTVELTEDVSSRSFLVGWGRGDSAGDWQFEIGDDGINDVAFQVRNDFGNKQRAAQLTTLTKHQKHRLVGVIDTANSELRVYLDGSLESTFSISGSYSTEVEDNVLCERPEDNDKNLPAYIDEPLLDQTAWGDTEVQDDYNRQPWS